MRYIIFLIITIGLIACNENQSKSSTPMAEKIAIEIDRLDSIHLQTKFLEDILAIDQKVRIDAREAQTTYGHLSKEHIAANKLFTDTDDINIIKIEQYLRKFGYPTLKEHGKEACVAPWLVVHHAKGGVAPRRKNFKYIYEAWKKEDLDGGALTFYLNRMYQSKFGYRIDWKRAYSEEEELDSLYNSLDLIGIITEIDKQYE